jgi:HSP20 family protein
MILVKAELPGIDQENLKVDLANGVVTIRGEKKEEKGENVYRLERSFGSFSRSFRLPCEVQEDKVEAKYKDGVLSLTLPKAETGKKTSIKVKVE